MNPESEKPGGPALLSFTHDASSEAIRLAAEHCALTRHDIRDGTVADATSYLSSHPSPTYLLVEITSADNAERELDALAEVLDPNTRVIVCGKIDSMRFYHWLMDIGIHEYLLEPFTEMQLGQALKPDTATENMPHAAATVPSALVAVMGARGGVGATTIAVNLAALLAREGLHTTGLFDPDYHFGSAALALNLEPGHGLRDGLDKPDRVDSVFLDRVMAKPFQGLSVLAAEEPLAAMEAVQPEGAEAILAAMRKKFPMLVVDVPRQMSPFTRHVLAAADHVVIVAEPQLASLRDALKVRDYLMDTLKKPAPQLVLNRIGLAAGAMLSARAFAKHYGTANLTELPYLPDIIRAGAEGVLWPDHVKLAQALAPLRALTHIITGTEAATGDPQKPQSFFSMLRTKVGKR